MYRDSRGYVTVGIGFLIEDTKTGKITGDAEEMPFVKRACKENPKLKATPAEIRTEFEAVKKQPYLNKTGKPCVASSFKTSLDLDDNYITKRFNEYVTNFWDALRKEYLQFDTYPMAVQYALLDMIFNLGRGTEWKDKQGITKRNGIHQYVSMRIALDDRKWDKAGDCSRRNGISEQRNTRIKEWFYSAKNLA